jgi:hypothetical protein
MKRLILGIIAMLFALSISVFLTKFISPYFHFYNLRNEVFITWQDEESKCGKPRKSLFSDELIVIDNPLCNYSADLHEIPTVSYAELTENPKYYDQKIVRVKGRFYSELEDEFNSRLYMKLGNQFAQKHIGAGYWSFNDSAKLCKFIDTNASDTNSADVTLIIQFLDASDNPSAIEHNDNSPFLMTILHVEEIKVILPVNNKSSKEPRKHKNGYCRGGVPYTSSSK